MNLATKTSRLLLVLGSLSLVLSFTLGVLLYWAHANSSQAAGWVDQSYRARLRLAALLKITLDAETAARGYSLTGEAEFLAPLQVAAPDAGRILAELRTFIADNPEQLARADQLQSAISSRIDLAHQVVAAANPARERLPALVRQGQELTNRIRTEIAAMEKAEWELLTTRLAARAKAERTNKILAWALLLSQACVWPTLALLYRAWWRREHFVRIYAWSKTIQHEGEWITFEQYLERRFGISATHGISRAESERIHRELEALRKGS